MIYFKILDRITYIYIFSFPTYVDHLGNIITYKYSKLFNTKASN